MCAPPGTGKTRMAKWKLASSANHTPTTQQSGKNLFCVYGRPLVDNAITEFDKEPALPHGVIMSDRDTAYGHRVQVASIDTLLSWFVENDAYQNDLTFDFIVYDETHAHLSKLATFLKYHDAKREELGLSIAYVIGLSASPGAKGQADIYKEIVSGPSVQWLIDNKYLAPFQYFGGEKGQLDKLVLRGGEFTKKSEAAAMDGLSGALVRDWKKYAEGRPTLGFFPRRSHAKDAMVELKAAGLRVDYVDGDTPDDERTRIFRALNEHWIDYLCNVQVVERGTDIPCIGCVQLCVAVRSFVRLFQMIGRGSRFDQVKYPQKKDCIVIDHGGSVSRLGLFEDDHQWTLDITTKEAGELGTRPTIECPKCHAIYRGGKCSRCGYEPTKHDRRCQGLEFDGSELQEVTRKEPKKTKVKSAEVLMVLALYQAGRSGRTWKQGCGIFRSLCEKQGSTYRVPKTVNVAGHQYTMLRYGSDDSNRRVTVLFPFVSGGGHGGDYLVNETATAQVAPY